MYFYTWPLFVNSYSFFFIRLSFFFYKFFEQQKKYYKILTGSYYKIIIICVFPNTENQLVVQSRSHTFPFGVQRKPLHQRAPKARVVRMGGWLGGYQKGPSILLSFKNIKKQDVLIPNMVLKVIYGFYKGSYEHFKF